MCFVISLVGPLVLLAPGLLPAADGPPATSPAAILANLKRQQEQAREEQGKGYEAAKTDAERSKVIEKYGKTRDEVVAAAVDMARNNPKDPASLEALTWVITGGIGWGPDTAKAFDLILRDHIQSDKLEQVCLIAGIFSHDKVSERFLRALLDTSPHRSMRGLACLSLARNLKFQAARARYEKKPDADQLVKEAEAAYERAAADFADVRYRDRKVGERAKAALFEMRNLVVGMVAPDIEGEDIDGKKFKLSDYRGKVVLLDFWGHW
jgi:hypothetical protein